MSVKVTTDAEHGQVDEMRDRDQAEQEETGPRDTTISSSKTHTIRQSPTRTGAVARYVEIPAINNHVPVLTTYQLGMTPGDDRDQADQSYKDGQRRNQDVRPTSRDEPQCNDQGSLDEEIQAEQTDMHRDARAEPQCRHQGAEMMTKLNPTALTSPWLKMSRLTVWRKEIEAELNPAQNTTRVGSWRET
jgi:hypothetical protein